MAPLSLPPGFGFHPTDEELVAYYLKRKIHGHKIELDIIPEVDLYKCEPWDLPEKSSMHGKESSWHFFSARDRKYPNGARTNRATEAGYWKATGKDRKVTSQKRLIGTKKTLVFHQGRAPLGKRTDWIMHEYRIDESECNGSKDLKDTFVLCRVFKKNGWQTKAEEVEKQIENDIQSSKKRISTDEASEKSSDPQARSPEDIKPLLLPKTHETLQDLPEEVFTVEEMLNMLEDVSEPDNNFVPSEWNSNAMEAESAFKPSPPSEDQDLPWYSEDYTFSSSTGATPEQSNDAEILEELLQVIQASEAYTDNQSHIQEEEAYGTLDYKNVKETNDASENWGDDFQFDQEDAGIQIRPRKQFVDPSESATIARIRMKSNLADIGSSVDRRENHVFHEKRDENEAYLAELQEQIFLLDSFEMQNNGPKISSNCYFTATPTGIEIERNTDGKLLPAQNQSVNCNSGILNVNKNGDAASGSLPNHVVSAMYADTCLMNGGSTEVVESQEQPLVLNESELVTYKGDCKDHQEKQKENNIVGNAKGCSVTDGSENNHEDITSQLTLSRFRRRSSRARPVEGSGDSQEQCHKTINSTSHHINEVTLTESTSSSPTTLILYLCLVGTTFLFFFLFRCILRAVRTVMSVSL